MMLTCMPCIGCVLKSVLIHHFFESFEMMKNWSFFLEFNCLLISDIRPTLWVPSSSVGVPNVSARTVAGVVVSVGESVGTKWEWNHTNVNTSTLQSKCVLLYVLITTEGAVVVVNGGTASDSGTIENKRDEFLADGKICRNFTRNSVAFQLVELLVRSTRKYNLLMGNPLSPARENETSGTTL